MNNDFINIAIDYKKRIASRYIAIEDTMITSRLAPFKQFLASVKHDGHFYVMAYHNEEVMLINRSGKTLKPNHIHKTIGNILKEKGVEKLIIAGELYVESEYRTRQFNVSSAIADGGKNLRFAAFDLLELEDELYNGKVVFEKYDKLKELFPDKGEVHIVEYIVTDSKKEVEEYFNQKVLVENHEGLVVKTESFSIFKVKQKFTFDAVIVGFASGDGERSDLLRDFLLAFRKDDGSYQIFAHLSQGFSDEERKDLLTEYKKKVVKSDYLEVSKNRLGFQMVNPETVVEFSCIDVINQDSKGDILKMNLSFDDKNGYSANYKQPTISVNIAVFERFREDKKTSIEDVNFKQIEDVIAFDDVDLKNTATDLPKTEIIKREVYVKESKGHKMVRKFIILKTNKEKFGNFPTYVFHYSDFSAGRKSPLKRDVRVTDSKEQVFEIYDKYIVKKVKAGWEKNLD